MVVTTLVMGPAGADDAAGNDTTINAGGFGGNMSGFHDVVDSSDAAMDPPAIWITNAFDRSPMRGVLHGTMH